MVGQWQGRKVIQISPFSPLLWLTAGPILPAATGGCVTFPAVVFMAWVRSECPMSMLPKYLVSKRPHSSRELLPFPCFTNILLPSCRTSMAGNTASFSVLYCVIIYEFHTVATFDLCGEQLSLDPCIRLYLAAAYPIANKGNLWFHKDYVHRLFSYLT